MTDPAEWEGSAAGGDEGGKSSLSFSLFTHFHLEGPPVARHLALPFTGGEAVKCSSGLVCYSGGLQSDTQMFEYMPDRKLVGRSIDYGGTEMAMAMSQ